MDADHTCGLRDGRRYALRFPRLLRIRDDKSVKDISTTDEVIRMFDLQRAKG